MNINVNAQNNLKNNNTYAHIYIYIYILSGRSSVFICFSLPDRFQETGKQTVKKRAAQSSHAVTKTGKQPVKNSAGNSGENFQIDRTEKRVKHRYKALVNPVFFAQMCPQA